MYSLRKEYQEPCHELTLKHARNYTGPAYIDHTVGAGKTIQIAFFAKHCIDKGARVLVLARQGELIDQNSIDAWEIGLKNSIFSASLGKRSTYYPCVMGTEGTVGRALDSEFKDSPFNIILIDECHHVDFSDCLEDDPESQYGKILNHFLKLNKKTQIYGYTGSPIRNNALITGKFWSSCLHKFTTHEAISMGYLVPPVFGFSDDEHTYDLKEFKPSENEFANDFSQKDLQAMGRKITKDETKTQQIMQEVIERTRGRNGVLITCASKKHCQQVADCLPDGSWGIVTDSTSTKLRKQILDDAKDLKIKYVIQIGCLTTGVNVPVWDCLVILRKIGSLTYLIQLIGRVLRTLKQHHIDNGLIKDNAQVLDYTDTFERLGSQFENPILEAAATAKAFESNEVQECPECNAPNSMYAVRCVGHSVSSDDTRCEHYFKFAMCFNCMTKNAPSAKSCRKCDAVMIDPNRNLINKAYSDADYKPVLKMELTHTKSGDGICVIYNLASTYHKNGIELQEVAKEFFKPKNNEQHNKSRWFSFLRSHIRSNNMLRTFSSSSIDKMITMQAMLDVPARITHRVNDKGFSIINRKEFKSGRQERAN